MVTPEALALTRCFRCMLPGETFRVPHSDELHDISGTVRPLELRVALLTNFIPPYRLALYRAVAEGVRELRVFVSTPMEPNRNWVPDWSGLDVVVQRNWTLTRSWRHPEGFTEANYVHFPYDTVYRLWKYRPDVVVSHEVGLRTVLALCFRRIRRSSRLVLWAAVSDHSERGRGRLREWLRRRIIPRMDAVLVNGSSGARYIQRFGVPVQKIHSVPYTIDYGPFLGIPLARTPMQQRRLLYVGQLVERKGLVGFLSVLADWARANPERGVELWVVGDGPQRDLLAAEPLPRNLELNFRGAADYSALPTVYGNAGILVFPTLADEWGVVVNEAMAAGLPVLGSVHSQAVDELVRDGVTGWRFRPDCRHAMYQALTQALDTPIDSLQAMRASARARVRGLSPQRVADRILAAVWQVHASVQGSS